MSTVVMSLQEAAAGGLLGWHTERARAVAFRPTPKDPLERAAMVGEMRAVITGLLHELTVTTIEVNGYRRLLETGLALCPCGCGYPIHKHMPIRAEL
nr:hypothetical protein KPHV_60210 [Kitasatospora purpeofusca]